MKEKVKAFMINIKNNEDYKEIYDYIKKLEDELKIITKDFEKIYCENQKLKQELDKLKELKGSDK